MSDPNEKPVSSGAAYEAGAFDERAAAGRVSGTLFVDRGALRFESETLNFELPIRGLQIKRGGANHRHVFFKHPDHPDRAPYVTDPSILSNESLRLDPDVAAQLGSARREGRNRKLFVLGALGVFVLGLLGLWGLKGLAVTAVARNVPVEWEQQLGEVAFEQVKAQGNLVDDRTAQTLLREMVQPLVQAVDDNRYDFNFHIAVDPTVNAFALPGGYVVVNTGLLTAAERPEEVLGVLAHEIAHVTHQHGVRRMLDHLGTFVLIGLLTGGTDLPAELVDIGAQLLVLSYSRDNETEADLVGFDYLTKAGIDPRGLGDFFRKLHAQHGSLAPPEMLSTHPASENRFERIEERWAQLPDKARFEPMSRANFDALRKALKLQAGVSKPEAPEPSSEGARK